MPGMSFEGFSPEALRLLRGVGRNNDRAWFAPRKERFEIELFAPMRALVRDASEALGRAKIPIRGDEKKSVFRIYRDVRFAHDKSPYRTNAAAYLSYDGGRDTPGGIYIHIEPGKCFLSAAFYRIEKPMLERWRRAMASRPKTFARVLAALDKARLPLQGPDDDDHALVRMPRGYDADDLGAIAPYFRLRSFCADRALTDSEIASRTLVDRIVTLAKDAKPLLDFGWSLE
jgi:uncharacterized protein (TIGR02453 family)